MNIFQKGIIPILLLLLVVSCKDNSTSSEPEPEPEPQCELSLSTSSIELGIGESATLEASTTNGCVGLVSWESDDTDIISLDANNGESVEATGELDGEATITVSVEDSDGSTKSRTIDATVTYNPVAAYRKTAESLSNDDIWVVDAYGNERQVTQEGGDWGVVFPTVQWINNGEKLAYLTHQESSVHTINLDGTGKQTITDEDTDVIGFRISHDEERIAIAGHLDGQYVIYVQNRSTGTRVEVQTSAFRPNNISWSPDDQQLAIVGYHEDAGQVQTGSDIYIVDPNGADRTRKITDGRDDYEVVPTWSPFNSEKILFLKADPETDATQTYMMNSDGSNVQLITDEFACTSWISESEFLCMGQNHGDDYDLYRVKANGTSKIIMDTPEDEIYPDWKPQSEN